MKGYIKLKIEQVIQEKIDSDLYSAQRKDWEQALEEFCENTVEE